MPVAHLHVQSHPRPDRSCLGFRMTMPRRPYCKRDANLQHKPDAGIERIPSPTGCSSFAKQHKYAKYTKKTTNSDWQPANLLVSLADQPRSCPKSLAPAAVDARAGFLSVLANQPSQPTPNAPVQPTWLPDLPCHTLDRPPCQLPYRAGPTCIAPDTRPKYAFPIFLLTARGARVLTTY